MKITCPHCGRRADKPTGEVTRAKNAGVPLYCGRRCAGLGRRKHIPKAVRVANKRLYDIEYRRRNHVALKVKRAAYFQATYDPKKARVERKKRAKAHAEYCRRPEYRRWKQNYDRNHLAKKNYGPFAEAAMLTIDLNREIKGRMTNDEIKWQNKTANKTQFRRREGGEEKGRRRPRFRGRRDGHSPAVGQ